MRIVFDKNVPVGVRRFLTKHEVFTFVEMQWHPQLENGELLKAVEASGMDVIVTSDQNIRYQQNLTDRRFALIVPGSNIWPVVRDHGSAIAAVERGERGLADLMLSSLVAKRTRKRAPREPRWATVGGTLVTPGVRSIICF